MSKINSNRSGKFYLRPEKGKKPPRKITSVYPSDFIITCPKCGHKAEDMDYEAAIGEAGTFRPDGRIPRCYGDYAWKRGLGWNYIVFSCVACHHRFGEYDANAKGQDQQDIEQAMIALFDDIAKPK